MDASPRPASKRGTQEPEPTERSPAAGAEPAALWQGALDQLRHQMPADTFVSLLRDSHLVEAVDGSWTIGVRPHAVQWLSNRPYPLIKKVVAWLAGREANLVYMAKVRPAAAAAPTAPAPEPSQPATPPPAPPQFADRPSQLSRTPRVTCGRGPT